MGGRPVTISIPPRFSSEPGEAMKVIDAMRKRGHRWLLNADQDGLHLRRVVWVVHDGIKDEKKYTCDKPLGTAKNLEDFAAMVCRAALEEVKAEALAT